MVSFPCLLEHFRLKSEPTTEEHLLVLPTRVGSWPYPQIQDYGEKVNKEKSYAELRS